MTHEDRPLTPDQEISSDLLRRADYARGDGGRIIEWLSAHQALVLPVVWVIVIASITVGVVLWASGALDVDDAGYSGAFIINLVGAASVVLPLPGFAAACAAAAGEVGLNLPLLAFIVAVAATIGEITGYLAGYGGHGLVQKVKYYDKIHNWVLRRGGAALFVLAAVPNPAMDIGGIAAGSLGYPIHRFLLWIFLGKLLKFIVLVYACRNGIDAIVDLAT